MLGEERRRRSLKVSSVEAKTCVRREMEKELKNDEECTQSSYFQVECMEAKV